jgi:CheY-like chemotaxis protein
MLAPMLESPALLQAAGLAAAPDRLTLRGVLANGAAFERTIQAEERDRSAWVSSSQRMLFPTSPDTPMVSLLSDADPLPAYLKHRSNLFVLETLPERGVYVGIGHNGDADEFPIATFLDGALARVRSEQPAYVVLDMRMNGGGDYTTTYAFAQTLPKVANGAPIYVFTSPWTFSAAITTVAALETAGGNQVHIVGEPVGDRLDFWAEGGSFNLPNAFVQVHYATGRHVYNGPCRDRATCFWLNDRYPVRVRTLEPDIAAPLTFAAYRALRDPAMDAVLAQQAWKSSTPTR